MVRCYEKKVGTKNNFVVEKRWEFSVRYIDEDGKQKQKHLRDFPTEKDCIKSRDEFLFSVRNNTKREGLNFEYLFNEYRKNWVNHSPSTVRVNTYWFEGHILPYFRNYLVSQIKISDVIDFQNKLRLTLRDNTVKDITSQLKSFMNYCVVNKYIDSLPFSSKYTSVQVKDNKEQVIWDIGEFSRFIGYYKDDVNRRTVFLFLFSTGIRKEELLGIQKGDINLTEKTVEIRRTYQFIGGVEYLSQQLKTKGSRRTLSLPKPLVNTLRSYLELHPDLGDSDRLFPFKPRKINKWMDLGIKKTGVPRTTPHGLRHSFISNSLSKGVPLSVVQKYVGHTSCRTTLDIYTHLKERDEKSVCSVYDQELTELESSWF